MSAGGPLQYSQPPSCKVVLMLDYEKRCDYVRETADCNQMNSVGNYVEILYCSMNPSNDSEQILCSLVLMIICLLIYLVLGCTVENVFCPALKVVSKILGMNEHLAGVTLLAFGNGSPDLVGTFTDLDDPGMFPDLFGAAVFVVLLVGGLICIFYPFEMEWNNILRDACFFSLGIIYVDYCTISDAVITPRESILILSVYISYLFVIFMEQFLLKQSIALMQSKMKDTKYATVANLAKLDLLRAEAGIEIRDRTSLAAINVHKTRTMSFNASLNDPNKDLRKQLFESLQPINEEEWSDSNSAEKVYLILTAPVVLILHLFIPVVDYEQERHGWSKLLNSLQMPLLPLIIVYTLAKNVYVLGIPLCCYTLLVTVPTACYMLYSTRTDLPPAYHEAMALYGAGGSVLIIYFCATESDEILETIGMVTRRSNSFLDCTLQAWGNSISDLISILTLARHGYPRMGYAACFGGPFFNSITSLGGVFMFRTLDTGEAVQVMQGSLGENCVIFLFIATTSVLVWATLTNFSARRSIGVFNLILYAIFLTFIFMGEFEIIETFAPEKEEESTED